MRINLKRAKQLAIKHTLKANQSWTTSRGFPVVISRYTQKDQGRSRKFWASNDKEKSAWILNEYGECRDYGPNDNIRLIDRISKEKYPEYFL